MFCEKGILKSDTSLLEWPTVMGPIQGTSSSLTRGHNVGNGAGELTPVYGDSHSRILGAVERRGLAVS